MSDIPKFKPYGVEGEIAEQIQPTLGMREWSDVPDSEKQSALQQIINSGVLASNQLALRQAIRSLNHQFLRLCPRQEAARANTDP